jgi:hypothetical protein
MDDQFKKDIAEGLAAYKPKLDHMLAENPYAVPISTGTWGGAVAVTQFASEMYFLQRAFPELVGPGHTLHAIDHVLGRHPVSNVSYVSGVGAQSKLIAFIPGGIIPGVVIIQPDFPELKEAWPFLWCENEYVVDTDTSYILAENAAQAETKSPK